MNNASSRTAAAGKAASVLVDRPERLVETLPGTRRKEIGGWS
jgi:hypothetical protein